VQPARHLLVVDDDAELCQLLSQYLVPEGYDVEAVRSGLGLAITKRVFEVHGGTATATNAEGGGFVVSLDLPLRNPGGRDHSHADDTRPTTREHSNAITAA
jgi:CheY-like chemotaxis protein